MIGARERPMDQNRPSPLILEPDCVARRNLASLAQTNVSAIEERLLEYGALLFRGFQVQEVSDFAQFVGVVSRDRVDYTYRSTPRTPVGERIFTATEYPATQEIPLHNENAYQREWPLKIAFCCLTPAASGGETPLAHMSRVSAQLGNELLDKFERRRVRYIRHYHSFVDLPWETVFQTRDRAEVARFCARHEIAHEWLDGEILRTVQVCQGVAYHPETRQRIFFNQAHLFHVSSLGQTQAKAMMGTFGALRLPRHACYGDGQEISAEELLAIRSAFAKAQFQFSWQSGDVLLLDNMQYAHGRCPYKGTRRVVAALMDLCSGDTKSAATK
jgi:alpha-ketoglutarate-dependent taurine dioxygenase